MPNVKSGIAKRTSTGNPVWDIVNGNGMQICRFNHSRFPHIGPNADVKFIDDDLIPGMAESVWSIHDVNPLVASAIPDNGATALGHERLEFYVMYKLTLDLLNQQSGITPANGQLATRMGQIKNALNAMPGRRATTTTLRAIGV